MIKINLLAASPGAAAPREWLPREQRSAVLGLGLLLVTAAGVGGSWYYLHRTRAGLDSKIAHSEAEIVRLKVAAKLVDETTARKNELTERLSLIERLRAAKREPVSLLETVSKSVPEGLWLVEIKQNGMTVQIDGRATSITSVTDFTERIQDSGLFRRPVEILTTTTETIDETALIRFSVKAEVEQPANRAVPATSGAAPLAPAASTTSPTTATASTPPPPVEGPSVAPGL